MRFSVSYVKFREGGVSCVAGVMRCCMEGLIWWYFCPHLDGELAKQHSDPSPSPTTSTGGSSIITTTTPPLPLPYPLPADTSPTSGHAPRLKRPTFLPIKNHARPATDKQGGKGDERVHDNTPLSRSTGHKAPSSSSSSSSSYASLSRLPISMYQLPAVVTPTVVTPGIGGCLLDGRTASAVSSSTTNTPSTATPTSAPENTLVARRNKAVYEEEEEEEEEKGGAVQGGRMRCVELSEREGWEDKKRCCELDRRGRGRVWGRGVQPASSVRRQYRRVGPCDTPFLHTVCRVRPSALISIIVCGV
ncbi:hypothetical protein Pmani_026601 [Petrolisthes manimaculis]|uniref:Uncharacterized protein n=1 Tax=Petrolisthes manimaculis TaxID=1843537 RepID=A0AAE1P5Q7_9EUCA|nr:hypothetical protein Pmani_026601 [Petrolisthes manimaculis]